MLNLHLSEKVTQMLVSLRQAEDLFQRWQERLQRRSTWQKEDMALKANWTRPSELKEVLQISVKEVSVVKLQKQQW